MPFTKARETETGQGCVESTDVPPGTRPSSVGRRSFHLRNLVGSVYFLIWNGLLFERTMKGPVAEYWTTMGAKEDCNLELSDRALKDRVANNLTFLSTVYLFLFLSYLTLAYLSRT